MTRTGVMSKLASRAMFTWISIHSLLLTSKACVKHPSKVQLSTRLTSSASVASQSMENKYHCKSQLLAPSLTSGRHKGQAGRIGIFGGSLEYTGAPYFAAISALRVGADLVHVFCTKDAASVIKSYSPELIVHPLLDDNTAVNKIEPWLDRLHVIIIGPGLGREPSTFEVIEEIIKICRNTAKPLVIDADGLFLISQKPDIIKNYPRPGVILTPNVMEFGRLMGNSSLKDANNISALNWGKTVTVLRKGPNDEVMNEDTKISVSGGGSGRRCGGQGDLLSGALATFYTWAIQNDVEEGSSDERSFTACYAASVLTRECNARAFAKKGRGMVCSDMIEEIPGVFRDLFELK